MTEGGGIPYERSGRIFQGLHFHISNWIIFGMWKAVDIRKEQSSPGNLQVGHVPSNWTRQMPHTSSSGISQRQDATAFHSLIVTFIAVNQLKRIGVSKARGGEGRENDRPRRSRITRQDVGPAVAHSSRQMALSSSVQAPCDLPGISFPRISSLLLNASPTTMMAALFAASFDS